MHEGKHRLVRLRQAGQGERARLVTPDGEALELTREKWLRLAQVVGQMFGTSVARPKPARAANHGQRWTRPLDADLAMRWRQGETEAALATRFRRSRGAVENRLVALELIHPMTHAPLVGREGIGLAMDLPGAGRERGAEEGPAAPA